MSISPLVFNSFSSSFFLLLFSSSKIQTKKLKLLGGDGRLLFAKIGGWVLNSFSSSFFFFFSSFFFLLKYKPKN